MADASPLTAECEALIRISAALATRDAATVSAALERGSGVAQADAVEEVILQAHLFVGFPDALEAMVLWRSISGIPAPDELAEDQSGWATRGEAVCATVYGSNYEKLRRNVRELHPALDRWMVVGGYGRVIGRPSLDLQTRELCIAALLAVWSAPRQLHSHLRGALNAGAGRQRVDAALELAREFAPADKAAEAAAVWRRVTERGRGSDAGFVTIRTAE